jgi:hypothetical protein
MDFIPHIEESCKIVMSSYGVFKKKTRDQVKTVLSSELFHALWSGC